MASRHLKIYGDPAKLRDLIRKSITRGNALLAEAHAMRDIFAKEKKRLSAGASGLALSLTMIRSTSAIQEYRTSVGRWDSALHRSATRLLGSQVEKIFVQDEAYSSHPADKYDQVIRECELQIQGRIDELEKLLKRIPISMPEGVKPEVRPFEELRLSGLIEEVQLNEYLKRMSSLRTRPQISAAIGSAKELTEATLRSILEVLAPGSVPSHDFHSLAKQVRKQIEPYLDLPSKLTLNDPVNGLISGLVSLENNLTFLRNNVGTGHGKVSLPPGLSKKHALLARDVAYAYTRYLVLTLSELGFITISEEE